MMLFLMSLNPSDAQFKVEIDNDILFGTDREFTGGLELTYSANEIQLNHFLFADALIFFLPTTANSSSLDQISFAAIEVTYEAYNALTDGRLFTDDESLLKRESVVPWLNWGIGVSYNQFSTVLSNHIVGRFYQNQPEDYFGYTALNFIWNF